MTIGGGNKAQHEVSTWIIEKDSQKRAKWELKESDKGPNITV
jgi:hypothetical protein